MKNVMITKIRGSIPGSDEDGRAYVSLTYEVETENDVREITYPKVYLPFSNNSLPAIITEYASTNLYPSAFINSMGINFTLGYIEDEENGRRVYKVEEVIKTKTKKMTIEEIEKALGYKVEIVSDKKKGKK